LAGDRFFCSLVVHSFQLRIAHGAWAGRQGRGLAFTLVCLRELCVLENRASAGSQGF
jgi:hypothetical protein